MRNFLPILLVAAALSGCIGGDDPVGPVTVETTTLDGMTVMFTAANSTVTVGHMLNFTLDASAADMDDPDNFQTNDTANNTAPFALANWTVSFAPVMPGNGTGNQTSNVTAPEMVEGTGLPAMFPYTFQANGTFDVTAMVMAEGYESANVSLSIEVIDAVVDAVEEPVDDVVAGPVVQDADGSWVENLNSCPHILAGTWEELTISQMQPLSGVLWGIFEVDPATQGGSFTMTIDGAGLALTELDFYDESGAYMEYHGGDPGVAIEGVIPAGAGYGVALACGGGPADFVYQGISK